MEEVEKYKTDRYLAHSKIYRIEKANSIRYWFYGVCALLLIVMFLPWTQNIAAKGEITTLYQEFRPQELHSPIPGKIVKWYVKEGDFVKKGDTILKLTEIKMDYLDPNLLPRTQKQVEAKKGTVEFYRSKVKVTDSQIDNLKEAKRLKIEQLKNKLTQLQAKLSSEKAEFEAVSNECAMAKDQFERQEKMFENGLVSQTQLQQRVVYYQNALAKKTASENKIAQTKQDIFNIRIEQNAVVQEYEEKINKAEGDKLQSLGNISMGEGEVAKLEGVMMSYTIRNGLYCILAPQNGQIIRAKKSGIGEIIKEGERIVGIVPECVDYAVEMFVRPVDLPLVHKGQKVRFTFDGFPSIVFSGWPKGSFGTFSGEIVAYENSISDNGLFRVLVKEDKSFKKWPKELKLGSGAQALVLLKDVPIWYELWRNINAFPPDFYQPKKDKKDDKKEKK